MPKQTTVEKSQNVEIVEKFLDAFQTWCAPEGKPKLTDLEKWLDGHFLIKNNGRVLAKNASEYFARIEMYRNKYNECKISVVQDSILSFQNKVVLQFHAVFTAPEGTKHSCYKMAVATIENGKIVDWQEATHDTNNSSKTH